MTQRLEVSAEFLPGDHQRIGDVAAVELWPAKVHRIRSGIDGSPSIRIESTALDLDSTQGAPELFTGVFSPDDEASGSILRFTRMLRLVHVSSRLEFYTRQGRLAIYLGTDWASSCLQAHPRRPAHLATVCPWGQHPLLRVGSRDDSEKRIDYFLCPRCQAVVSRIESFAEKREMVFVADAIDWTPTSSDLLPAGLRNSISQDEWSSCLLQAGRLRECQRGRGAACYSDGGAIPILANWEGTKGHASRFA